MVETKDIGEPSKWEPITNPSDLAALGKLAEEVNELGAIIARAIIQGLLGTDPDTGKVNLFALQEEIADVRGLSKLVIDRYGLDESEIGERAERKRKMKLEWIRMLTPQRGIDG